jgi:tetratricopeptide (TPR) repeat protein
LLSYGLHQEAGKIFQTLIDAGAPPRVRDRAWFYLAKIRHQRGYIAEAEDAITRIGDALPGELDEERRVLHAYLLLQRGKPDEAVAMLRRVSLRSEWGVYGRYNLGVALVRAGEQKAGIALLDEIGRDPEIRKRGEEFAALSDRANVALAFAQLQGRLPVSAKSYLERVRLDGLMSNKALLGLGWMHSAVEEHERALVPWTELTGRAVTDTAVQESLLAVPFALGKLGAYRQALMHYEKALEAYTREVSRLDDSIRAIRGGALVENILRSNPGQGSGWFWRVHEIPDTAESRYLSELLASHDFQEGLKNYRDLRFLLSNLDEWMGNVQVYRDMLATRRQAYAERLPRVVAGERSLALDRVKQAHATQQQELARIEHDEDVEALATEKERALLARVERVRGGLAQVADPAEREAMQDRHRLLRGLLTWDMTAQYSARLWESKKISQETARALFEADQRRQSLAQAQAEVPASFNAFATRIDAMRGRIAGLQAETRLAARAQEDHLAALAVDELTRRREQILTYVTQARFAVAQIYDQAVRGPEKTP